MRGGRSEGGGWRECESEIGGGGGRGKGSERWRRRLTRRHGHEGLKDYRCAGWWGGWTGRKEGLGLVN